MTKKTDLQLGLRVSRMLVEKGIETPMSGIHDDMALTKIESYFGKIMDALGLDRNDDSLTDTPKRVAKMYIYEIFSGLNYENFPKCTTVKNKFGRNPIAIDGITSMSACEHHFVTIDGTASIRYVPNKVVLGLSKFHRIVEFFSKRPQIQERLTEQIFHALCLILDTEDVEVRISAVHYCVKSRGVEDHDSQTITESAGGVFKNPYSK